jgi:outer membrane protein insertion porin family
MIAPRRCLVGLALSAGLLSAPSVADAQQLDAAAPAIVEGKIIDVQLKGLRNVEEAAVLAVMATRAGALANPRTIQRDIKAIYRSGFVDDVVVEVEPAEGGIVVTFLIDEKPAIREVKVAGNKKLDEDALFEVIDITSFSVLNEADLKANIRRMRDKYLEKGFYLVEIEPVIREVDDDMVELTFDIVENRKVLVQKVEITGNENIPDRKIKKFLQTREAGMLPWLSNTGTFNEFAVQDDTQIVRQVLMEEGYYEAEAEPAQVYLSPDKRFIHVTINVNEGPRYKLGKIKIEGDFVPEEGLTRDAAQQVIAGQNARDLNARWKQARADVGEGAPLPEGWEEPGRELLNFDPGHPAMEVGDWFKLSTLQATMAEISDLYGDQGYAFANVIPDAKPDPETGVMDITFRIQRGEKVRIGRIDISGNSPTYDKVIRREIPINEGDVYSGSAVRESKQRLDRLGYFEEVRITTPRADAPDELTMKVDVSEQPTGSFSVGAGFSNIENFMFTMNVSKNNFLGLGYVMSTAAQVSRQRQQWNLQLFDPYFLDTRWTLSLNGYSIDRQFIENEYQRGASISVGRYLDRRDDMRLTFDYTYENTGLRNLDSYKLRVLGGQLYRNGITSTGGLSFILDKRNNRIQPTRGVYTTASVALSGGFRSDEDTLTQVFGGDFNFVESKANVRLYQPLLESEMLIFQANMSLGHILSTDGSVLPFIHRYRAGGITSVRGYDWFTLGPQIRASGFKDSAQTIFQGTEDPQGPDDRLIVGGTESWINNFEIVSPIIRQAGISTVVFFDAGNAFGDVWGNGHINPLELRTAYGAGVRWLSPMGPLRFEYGIPINPRPDERRGVFDFSIGNLF